MEITTIKNFIEDFVKYEYECNRNEFISTVSDAEFNILKADALRFYHSQRMKNLFVRGIAQENLKYFTAKQVKDFEKNSIDAIPRTLFQIKHYQHSQLGDALKRITIGNDLFACYVSYPSKGPRDLYFSSIFYVAETDEGLKIIYERSFDADNGVWYNPEDIDVVTVIEEGRLVGTEKYIAPVEDSSLADYNKSDIPLGKA